MVKSGKRKERRLMLFNIGKEKKIVEIPILQIRPCRTQARRYYSNEKLRELSQSIRQNGILQPLTVRRVAIGEYELVAGERRLRAAAMCGKTTVPCMIISCTDKQACIYSMTENLQRSDLNYFEEAEGFRSMIRYCGATPQEVAKKTGKKQDSVADKLKLMKFTKEERELIVRYHLSERHARALLRISDITSRKIILSEIISKSMNVSQSERYIEMFLSKERLDKENNQKSTIIIKDIRIFENSIKKAVSTMKMSGINVDSSQCTYPDYVEYTVKVPRPGARAVDSRRSASAVNSQRSASAVNSRTQVG